MRSFAFVWTLAVGLIAGDVFAQDSRPATAPTSRPTEADPIYDDLTLDNMTIDELAAFLTRTSSVDYQVYREAGLTPGLPRFERLHFRRTTANQLVHSIRPLFGDILEIEDVKTDPSPFPDNNRNREEGHTIIFHVRPFFTNDPVIKVYALPVRQPETTQHAREEMSDALSLIQAAVDQFSGSKAILSIHEPTRTLIVKATELQQQIVHNCVETLTYPPTTPNADTQQSKEKLQLEIDRLKALIGEASTTQPATSQH